MVIDEKTVTATTTSKTTPTAGARTPEPNSVAAIETWPTPSDELDEIERELAATGPETPRGGVPVTVRQWPVWLQKQWVATQRRQGWMMAHPPSRVSRLLSPSRLLFIAALLLVALSGFGLNAAVSNWNSPRSAVVPTSNTNMPGMGSSAGQSTGQSTSNVPDALEQYGNQPAKFALDKDGAKHFTLTARQVMWQPVKGQKVLAWTLDGTVPGPVIQATAGDHIRVTIVNHLPEATAIHWHGLEVPTDNDGVPPVGMKPIEPGQSYTYDFTLRDEDAGTHWYHSHYDDLKQVGGGMYGAFLVAPRPGSAQYQPMTRAETANVEQTMFFGMLGSYYVINGKSFPDTQPILVKHGQTVHLRLIGADTQMIHPMHLHGHSFQIVAEDGRLLPAPITKDTVDVSPGETFDIIFYAWAAPGSIYPFHCHILSHLMNPGQSGAEMGGLITLLEYEK
jgi:manganese oxidase